MRGCGLFVLGAMCACSAPPDEPDLCQIATAGSSGAVEVGVVLSGSQFVSIADGQDVSVELGLQGLYMFVTNARVRDMQIADGEIGAIEISAYAETTEAMISLDTGCREREFIDGPDGAELASPFWVALDPGLRDGLDGMVLRLRATVRDRDGQEAVDERRVVARLPQSM